MQFLQVGRLYRALILLALVVCLPSVSVSSIFTMLCIFKFLSVQCYAWTEYKFACVCVSVCLSVTLSVNSPTGETPQRIFTVESVKDADLHKDVLFGGLDDE